METWRRTPKTIIYKNTMKIILKRLLRDKVSLTMWLFTIAFAIVGFQYWLFVLILFIFRGIMWEGQYVEALNKYVTEPEYRKVLGLDKTSRPTPGIELVFQIIFMLAIVAAVIKIIFFSNL